MISLLIGGGASEKTTNTRFHQDCDAQASRETKGEQKKKSGGYMQHTVHTVVHRGRPHGSDSDDSGRHGKESALVIASRPFG